MRSTKAAVGLVLICLGAAFACPASATSSEPRCIKDDITAVFSGIVRTHALAGVTPAGWTLDHLSAAGDSVEVAFVDAAGGKHVVHLVIGEPGRDVDSAKGSPFVVRVPAGTTPADAEVLNRAAEIVRSSIPASVARACAVPFLQRLFAEMGFLILRPLALATGFFEIAVILAALLFSLGTRKPDGD